VVVDRQRVELGANAPDALLIGGARRVLGRDGDEVAREADQSLFAVAAQETVPISSQ
jgi:hypothetical protein